MNPELRFKDQDGKDFPDWEEKKLSDVYKRIRNAFVGTATPYYVDYGHFYLESNNVKDGKINRNSEIFINDFFYEKQKEKWLHTGDIVMVQSGHVGHTAVIPNELDNTAAHALIMITNPYEEINPYYINYYFQTNDAKRKIDNITKGNTIKHILASDVKKFNMDFCNVEEQEKVAKLLGDIDKKIESQAILVEKLKNTKDAMLVKMFPQGDSKVPEIRFDGFSGDWEEKKIGNILKICHGKDYKHLVDGNVPVYGTGGIMTYVNEYLCDWPCVCIGRKGTIDKPQYIDSPFWCVDTLFYSKPYENNSPLFQYYLFHNIKWNSYNAATGVPSLNGNVIEKITIKVPEYDEQEKIGDFFVNLDKEIEINQKKYEKLCDVKKALLHKMFPTKGDE